MTPGEVRSQLENLRAGAQEVEEVLTALIGQQIINVVEVRHEVTEAWEALERAIEILDTNYEELM